MLLLMLLRNLKNFNLYLIFINALNFECDSIFGIVFVLTLACDRS